MRQSSPVRAVGDCACAMAKPGAARAKAAAVTAILVRRGMCQDSGWIRDAGPCEAMALPAGYHRVLRSFVDRATTRQSLQPRMGGNIFRKQRPRQGGAGVAL